MAAVSTEFKVGDRVKGPGNATGIILEITEPDSLLKTPFHKVQLDSGEIVSWTQRTSEANQPPR